MPRPALTQRDLLRRRCASALAHHRRRARAEGVTLAYGLDELVHLAASVACAYCYRPLGSDLTFDHGVPTSRPGGSWALANLFAVCPRCNALKGRLTRDEYRALCDFLDGQGPAAAEDLTRRLLAGGRTYRRRKRGGQ